MDRRPDHLQTKGSERLLWIALIGAAGLSLSTFFACATPFAALATLAAFKLGRRDAILVVAATWLINQGVGFGLLGYPRTWDSAAWGLAIGASAMLAVFAARGLATTRPAPLAVSLPFVAAFAAFESGLYAAGYVLPGSEGAFTVAVIGHIFLINAATLFGLTALHQVLALGGRLARQGGPASLAAGAASFR